MSINKNGIWNQSVIDNNNLYTGKQYNASNMSLTYDYETDIFKSYGYTKALKLTPTNTSTSQFMAYSYLLNSTFVYDLGQEYTVAMYAYVSPDCNANFRLNLEHSNTWIANYQNTTSNINDTTKGSVIYVWGKCRANATDGKIYIMFYPNPNQANVFTTGYQLITGITILKGNEIIRPGGTGFIEAEKSSIAKKYTLANSFIEI